MIDIEQGRHRPQLYQTATYRGSMWSLCTPSAAPAIHYGRMYESMLRLKSGRPEQKGAQGQPEMNEPRSAPSSVIASPVVAPCHRVGVDSEKIL